MSLRSADAEGRATTVTMGKGCWGGDACASAHGLRETEAGREERKGSQSREGVHPVQRSEYVPPFRHQPCFAVSQQCPAGQGQATNEDGLAAEHVQGPTFDLQHCKSNKAVNKKPKRPVRRCTHKARSLDTAYEFPDYFWPWLSLSSLA